jgi:hypothetical protein
MAIPRTASDHGDDITVAEQRSAGDGSALADDRPTLRASADPELTPVDDTPPVIDTIPAPPPLVVDGD